MKRQPFLMGALVEVDAARLDETVTAVEQAGRDVVKADKQKLRDSQAHIDEDRPATVTATVHFLSAPERADAVFDAWNDALAARAKILRTFLRGEDVFRESIDEGFQTELTAGWTEERQEETRRLIESMKAASAERDRQRRRWWRV